MTLGFRWWHYRPCKDPLDLVALQALKDLKDLKEPQGIQGTQGPQGLQGAAGTDGLQGDTPYIGENLTWWIGETDTGVLASLTTPMTMAPLVIIGMDDEMLLWGSSFFESEFEAQPLWLDGEAPTDLRHVLIADRYIVIVAETNEEGIYRLWVTSAVDQAPVLASIPVPDACSPDSDCFVTWQDAIYASGTTVATGTMVFTSGENLLGYSGVYAVTSNGVDWSFNLLPADYQPADPFQFISNVEAHPEGWMVVATTFASRVSTVFFVSDIHAPITMDQQLTFSGVSNNAAYEDYFDAFSIDFDNQTIVWRKGSLDAVAINNVTFTGQHWVMNVQKHILVVSLTSDPYGEWKVVDLKPWIQEAGWGLSEDSNFYITTSYRQGSDMWFVMSDAARGQIIASNDGGDSFELSVPVWYEPEIQSITKQSPALITHEYIPNLTAASGERLILSGVLPNEYNGTYYLKLIRGSGFDDYQLFLDSGLTIPFDTTGFGDITQSGTVTFQHGPSLNFLLSIEGTLIGINRMFTTMITTNLLDWSTFGGANQGVIHINAFAYQPSFQTQGVLQLSQLKNGPFMMSIDEEGRVLFPDGSILASGVLTLPNGGTIVNASGLSLLTTSLNTGAITFQQNTIQGNVIALSGSRVVALTDYQGGITLGSSLLVLSNDLPGVSDIQPGWIATFADGTYRTVTNTFGYEPNTEGSVNGRSVQLDGASPNLETFPVVFTSPDYQAAEDDPSLILQVEESQWLFQSSGVLVLPSSGTIVNASGVNVMQRIVDVPTSSRGSVGDEPGMIAFDEQYFYFSTWYYNGDTHIWRRISWAFAVWG
jgi:hypothetical protein